MKVFNSNIKKFKNVIIPTDLSQISGSGFLNKLIDDAKNQAAEFSGSYTTLQNYDFETSFDSRVKSTFNSKGKISLAPKIIRGEKDYVSEFRVEQMDITANWVFKKVDEIQVIDSETIKLILKNTYYERGIDMNENNFEIYMNGVKTPVIYTLFQNVPDLEITIKEFKGIDNSNKNKTNIYVKGKLIVKEGYILTEDGFDLFTEDYFGIIY